MKNTYLLELFDKFTKLVGLPNYNNLEITKGIKCLKLDYNSTYGGYRIDIVNEDTSERFWNSDSRVNRKVMVAYLQGFIDGAVKTSTD